MSRPEPSPIPGLFSPQGQAAEEALPWSDCKVAFGINGDEAAALSAWMDTTSNRGLPAGWFIDEVDNSGARSVAVFRVEGVLRPEDGQQVISFIAGLPVPPEDFPDE